MTSIVDVHGGATRNGSVALPRHQHHHGAAGDANLRPAVATGHWLYL